MDFRLRKIILTVYIPAFLTSFCMGMLAPTIPAKVDLIGGTAFIIGLTVGAQGLGEAFFSIQTGFLINKFGNKKIMLTGMLGIAIAGLLSGFFQNNLTLYFSLFSLGIFYGFFSLSRHSFMTQIVPSEYRERNTIPQNHNLENALDFKILKSAQPSLKNKQNLNLVFSIKNTDRAVGAIISNEISKLYGSEGLPKETLKINFNGTAGQSFGAFSVTGLLMKIDGNANDYFGKGLSGATLIAKVPEEATFIPHNNIIIGNVSLYGATKGEAYINGIAGERFCVRNSGAKAVVEGVGDHGCEYMTGGNVLILGKIGRNFGAGMSGGIAYIYRDEKFDDSKFNMEMIDLEEINNQDEDIICKMLENHYTQTNSKIGKIILSKWHSEKNNFVKVMPKEYKIALEKIAQEKINQLIN